MLFTLLTGGAAVYVTYRLLVGAATMLKVALP